MNTMIKIFLLLILFLLPIASCSSVGEFKERAKGDGIPYIPGI